MPLNTTPASEDADAYANCEEFGAYALAAGYDLSSYDQAAKEQALRRATRWLDATYGSRFIGKPTTVTQALEWPRKNAMFRGQPLPDMMIPRKLKHALFEAAYREAEDPNSLAPDVIATQRTTMEKVGELQVQYADSDKYSLADYAPALSVVDGLLFGLLNEEANQKGVVQMGTTLRA